MPRLTLQNKVFLTLAALLVALMGIYVGFSRLVLTQGLGPYVAEIELERLDWLARRAVEHHVRAGNWDALRADPGAWHRLQMDDDLPFGNAPPPPGGAMRPPPLAPDGTRPPPRASDGSRPPPPPPGMAGGGGPQLDLLPGRHRPPPPPDRANDPRDEPTSIYRRLGLTDAEGIHVAGVAVPADEAARLPLREADKVVGYLVLAPLKGLARNAEQAFLTRQSRFMILTGLAGLALALLFSWLLARRWFAPIDALMDGARAVARGQLATRVPVKGSDELAALAGTFNDMVQRLDGIENSRREWLADVSHELRTPLAAMRAEIEALQDGVQPFEPDTSQRLHRQVMRLSLLVEDLRRSMSESGEFALNLAPVQPLALLRDAIDLVQDRFHRADIALDTAALDALAAARTPTISGDADRLHQVFVNLLENSLRYTDSFGTLRIGASIEHGNPSRLVLKFDDSAPGVLEHELPRIFDRLFRGESSRSRAHGGSGLGLAICRNFVEAHHGQLAASPSPLGGLRMIVSLPLAGSP
ncbi:ATP-binding protein [Variovorax sp. J22G21]|uniref:ATP-binding protein n=1 Tax=Variovorax fucosicus TaxID=3053517 RepID=UPI002578D708|nr:MULTISPECIES: ATP-binding protein [unclassified Variovorax]MDM0042181.1 ATP-binding protein [Variovorax sp. J22R193]MDM0059898.1 ATP-binding protein [Variovorax sp. J22G21]